MKSHELKTLEFLSEYKWDDSWQCYKCGCKDFSVRNENITRRCKNAKCRYEESVTKFTVFEGLRFPIEKAVQIVLAIWDSGDPSFDKKDITIEQEKRTVDDHNSGDSYSVKQLVNEYRQGNYSRTKDSLVPTEANLTKKKIDAALSDYFKSQEVTEAKLSTVAEVDENTVSKLLEKIATRIPSTYIHYSTDIANVYNYFASMRMSTRGLDYLFGFLMASMDENWNHSKVKRDGKWYKKSSRYDVLSEQRGIVWKDSLLTFLRKDKDGEVREYYNKPDEPEFLVEEDDE